ncbi:MAG: DUF433 domain-containing protein [Bacteroidales bacterium]|jgi:uncharacterized protein (DUF433 family)|nr:DUF433 domain-containing protein [Bacteroidales bacterium]
MGQLLERITINPEICNGKPIIRGMRITVTTVLEYLAAGESTEAILEAFPILEKEDILACLEFAKKISDKSIFNYDLKAS